MKNEIIPKTQNQPVITISATKPVPLRELLFNFVKL